jgi:hypothetical protein
MIPFPWKSNGKERIDPFMITVVLHSSGTFVIGKMTISRKNGDVTDAFHCSTTSFYGKGYYYHSQMSRMNTGPQKWLQRANTRTSSNLKKISNSLWFNSDNILIDELHISWLDFKKIFPMFLFELFPSKVSKSVPFLWNNYRNFFSYSLQNLNVVTTSAVLYSSRTFVNGNNTLSHKMT